MSVKHSNEIQGETVGAGKATTRQVLIGPEEGPNFAMRVFTIQPGGSMPNHGNTVEHEQYVLDGQADIGIGDRNYTVQKGDVVFIPANVPHWYKCKGDVAFKFLCMVPNKKDEITILEK